MQINNSKKHQKSHKLMTTCS